MKKEWEKPELHVEYFTLSSPICTENDTQWMYYGSREINESGMGWEEEEEEW